MESIKADSSLLEKPAAQPSPDKMNSKNRSRVFDYMDSLHADTSDNPRSGRSWIIDGVAFPNGTEFRGSYKGYNYRGKVSDGALILNGKEFLSPCAAAITITRIEIDGWLFWDCKLPGMSSWIDIYSLKHTK
ncbi:MAG: hypothetical protein P8012_03365 [Desulfobacterales bacterium]